MVLRSSSDALKRTKVLNAENKYIIPMPISTIIIGVIFLKTDMKRITDAGISENTKALIISAASPDAKGRMQTS